MSILRIALAMFGVVLVVAMAFSWIAGCNCRWSNGKPSGGDGEEAASGPYYVDISSGNDKSSGITIDSPFRTIHRAARVVKAGDVVYLRGGVYPLSSGLTLTASGTSASPITFEAFPGEEVIFDGSRQKPGKGEQMIQVEASWNILRNLEVRYSPQQGIYVSEEGNDNIFENIVTHHNYLSGLQIEGGCRNRIVGMISHSNYDSGDWGGGAEGDNADGISISSGTGNILTGCVCYNNSDDGIDTWESAGNTVEKCVCHHNGYDHGNGGGFKFGPGINNVASNRIENCISYSNSGPGFTTNSGADNEVYNNAAYNNYGSGFESWSYTNTFRNNIAYANTVELDSTAVQSHNSWNLGVSDPRFVSTDSSSPDFLSLAADSPAIDKGIDVGIPYSGVAPDLGALEYSKRIGDSVPAINSHNA